MLLDTFLRYAEYVDIVVYNLQGVRTSNAKEMKDTKKMFISPLHREKIG